MSDPMLPQEFVLGKPLRVDETRHRELKEVKGRKPVDAIKNASDEYAVAFLNSEGGRVLWGVRDSDSVVVGVTLSAGERDLLRREVASKLGAIQPQIDPTQFRLEIHTVSSVGSIEDLFVVELSVPRLDVPDPFYTASHEVFVRLDGVKQKLSGPQLTAWIKQRATRPRNIAVDVSNPAAALLVQRVQQIFLVHGLEVSHLSRFFLALKAPFEFLLTDAQSPGAWLNWLDDNKIDWIANTFQVRREWIDGEDDAIYVRRYFDKDPQLFWDTVSKSVPALGSDGRNGMPVAYFIRRGKGKEWEKRGQTGVFVVLALPVLQLSNERTVWRYISDFSEYPWNYPRTQIQLRAWARLLFCGHRFVIHGVEVSLDIADKIAANGIFLRDLIEDPTRFSRVDWHPDDYALSAKESRAAKSVESLPDVLNFLRAHSLPVDCPCAGD